MTAHGVDRSGAAGGNGSATSPIDNTLIDAKGDLIVGTAADTPGRLAVGANETRLVADSTQATGLKYVADTVNYAIGAKGDLLVGTAADTVAAKSVGTNGKVLMADSSQSDGLLWAALACQPGGRLTLTTATPVMTADVTAQGTVYYTPYKHNIIQLYDGAGWIAWTFSELSQATTDGTKSPAAVANNSNYDVFVWNDSGTLRATRGPAWSSATSRGAGAGTTELELFEGRYVNKNAITNGPAARRGLYVGSIRSNGTATVDWVAAPAAAAGGGNARLGVWNMYNRVWVRAASKDSTDTWVYNTATWRASNNSTSNAASLILGLVDDIVDVHVMGVAASATADLLQNVAVGVNSTTVNGSDFFDMRTTPGGGGANWVTLNAYYVKNPGTGWYTFTALEKGGGSGTNTWAGDDASATDTTQCGIYLTTMA